MKSIAMALLGLVNFTFSFAQNSGSITYDIKNIDFVSDHKNEDVDATLEIAKNLSFTLEFNSDLSVFFLTKDIKTDITNTDKFYTKLALITYATPYTFYFDVKRDLQLYENQDGNLIKKNSAKLNWEITNQTKLIGNYSCYKAIYKFEYLARDNKIKTNIIEAWFAPSLPYSYGPKEYHGLPGLILELTENETTYQATKIELFDKPLEINFPKGKTITEDEYNKKMSSY